MGTYFKQFLSLFFMLLVSALAVGDQVTFTGDMFPEEVGWERVGTSDADRWLENGSFYQYVDLGVWGPPPVGETDYYQRSVDSFGGELFFVEWRVQSSAPRSEIDGVGGAALALSGGINWYHFTIAEDQVRFLRDISLPILWIDIEPGVPHTYRLELDGADEMRWYIDGSLVLSDIPESEFPSSGTNLIWGAKYWEAESTNVWDYITYGTLPEPTALITLLLCGMTLAKRRKR